MSHQRENGSSVNSPDGEGAKPGKTAQAKKKPRTRPKRKGLIGSLLDVVKTNIGWKAGQFNAAVTLLFLGGLMVIPTPTKHTLVLNLAILIEDLAIVLKTGSTQGQRQLLRQSDLEVFLMVIAFTAEIITCIALVFNYEKARQESEKGEERT